MTWQTPKTDWSVADGVRDTDLNRIELNILELYNKRPIEQSIQRYVSPSGSDMAGSGASDNPYATIQKAIDSLPRSLNGYNATIFIAEGAYSDGVDISDITNGTITLANQSSHNIVINGDLNISDCASVQVSGFNKVTVNGQMHISNTVSVHFGANEVSVVDTVHGSALLVTNASVIFNGALSLGSLSDGSGILAEAGSRVFVESLTVQSGTGTGIRADYGGIASYNNITNNATVAVVTIRGGRIYSGAQSNIPVY